MSVTNMPEEHHGPCRGPTDKLNLHQSSNTRTSSIHYVCKSRIMANTYTQIHLQIVCVVKFREALIGSPWKEALHRYITGIVQKQEHKMLAINSMPDHFHMLIGWRPHQSISDLMRETKRSSTEWININHLTQRKFNWQEGYGAFSYHKSRLPSVINYIENQEEHHKKKSFVEEYKELLEEFGISYDGKYIFKVPE